MKYYEKCSKIYNASWSGSLSDAVFLVGCDKENDFYEVGRQPVFLTSPENEAIWTLNYQKPDSMYLFHGSPNDSLFILIWLSDLIMNLQERR